MTLRPKVSIYAGDHLNTINRQKIYILIGIIGSLFSLYGTSQAHGTAQTYFVIGSSLLLIAAIYFGLFYFIALEIILIAGHGTILLDIGTVLQVALPVLLSVQLLFFYFLSGRLNNIYLLTGILGIALISTGFAYNNQWVFFSGSLAIVIYAFYSAKKSRPSLIWAILNLMFALEALVKIYMR